VYIDEIITEYGLTDTREAKTPLVSLKALKPTSKKDKLADIN
jgi:hypothetical protein